MSRVILPAGLTSRPCPDHSSDSYCWVCEGTGRVWSWTCTGCAGRGLQWSDGHSHICDECGGMGRHTGLRPEEY